MIKSKINKIKNYIKFSLTSDVREGFLVVRYLFFHPRKFWNALFNGSRTSIVEVRLPLRKKIKKVFLWCFATLPRKIISSLVIIVLVFGPIAFLWNSQKAEAAWWNDMWQYRKKITVTNSSGSNLTDFQVKVLSNVDLSTDITNGKIQSDLDDLRFTDINGNLLPYWLEDTTTSSVDAWVKMPSIPTSGATIYMYYGNPSASSTQNGENVFEFFDDFSDANKTSANWTGTGTGFTVTGGNLYHPTTLEPSNSFPTYTINNSASFTDGIIESRMKPASCGPSFGKSLVARYTNDNNLYVAGLEAWTANYMHIGRRVSGTWTNLDNDVLACSADTWYSLKWTLNGTSQTLVANGVTSSATDSSFSSGKVGVSVDNRETATGAYWDWVFVRQYASTDPAAASPAAEEKGLGPVAYWSFDEGYGTNTNDATTNNNDGTLTNMSSTASPTSGWQSEENCIAGKCLAFDGSDDSVDTASIIKSTDITISAWVKISSSFPSGSRVGNIIGNYSSASNINFEVHTAGKLRVYWNNGQLDIYGTTDLRDDRWHNVMFTRNSTTNKITIYIDGKFETDSSAGSDIILTKAFRIGGDYRNGDLPNAPGIPFKGLVDEVKIYSYARSAAQIKMDYNAGLAGTGGAEGTAVSIGGKSQKWLTDGLVGHWKMDEASWNGTSGEVVDASGNGNNGTAAGGVTTAAGKFGNGGSFDGTDDYVSVSGTAGLITGASARTMSAWIKPTSATSRGMVITYGNNTDDQKWDFEINGWNASLNGKLIVHIWNAGVATAATSIVLNQWNHVVVSYSGGTLQNGVRMFINGIEQATQDAESGTTHSWTSTPNTTAANLQIGKRSTDNAGPFPGLIDETRIYNRALSPDEVSDLYNFAPGPVGYWKMDEGNWTGTAGEVLDASGNGNNGTIFGNAAITTGKFGKGGNFDGAGDGINVGSATSLDFGNNGAFTFAGWVKPTALGDYDNFVSKNTTGRNSPYTYMTVLMADGRLLAYYTGAWRTVCPAGSVVNGSWQHVAFVYDGAYISGYVNGSFCGTVSFTYTDNIAHDVTLGSWYSPNTVYDFNGAVDDIKIYNYVRTPDQIKEDMLGRDGSAVSEKSAVGYWKFDEGYGGTANNSSQQINNGTITGATWSNDGKFGKALYFDGVNSYVEVPHSASLSPTDKISISAWIKPISPMGEYAVVVAKPVGGWTGGYGLTRDSSTDNLMFWINTYTNKITIPFSYNEWQHVAAIYDGVTMKTFKNGALVDSKSYSTAITQGTEVLRIGKPITYNYSFKGSIDEVRVYNYALTTDDIALDYNRGKSMSLGSSGTTATGMPSNSADRAYCPPGDTTANCAPIAEWKFEEGSGSNIYASTGGYTSTFTGTPMWTQGKSGKSLSFDGSTNGVALSGPGTYAHETMSAWVYIDSASPNGDIVGNCHTNSNAYGFTFYLDGNTLRAKAATNADTYFYSNVTYDVSSLKDRWIFLTMTWDYLGTGSGTCDVTVKLYVNGKLVDEATDNVTNTPYNCAVPYPYPFSMGATTSNLLTRQTKVKLDNVKVYNYVRTPAQIAWDYNRGAPVGWWKMDEGEGISAKDSSGNDNHGTLTNMDGATDWVAGKINTALDFDGSSDHVDFGAPNVLQMGAGAITVSNWVKLTGTTDYRSIFFGGATGGGRGYGTAFQTGSTSIRYEVYGSTGGRQYYIIDGGITLNNWYHIVAIFDGIDNKMKLYVNGVEKHNVTISDPGTVTSSYNFYLGTHGGTAWYFPGQIDDVRVYNYALTQDQVEQVYNGGAVNFK